MNDLTRANTYGAMPGTQNGLSAKLFMHFLPALSGPRGAPRVRVIEFWGQF